MAYTTIPVRREVKEKLERFKGEREWSEYLEELLRVAVEARRSDAFRRLREASLEHLEDVEESHRRFRREFSLDSGRH